MRTNIEIDDALLSEAMRETGLKTKRAAIEEALRVLVTRERRLRAIEEFKGKVDWQGDLDTETALRLRRSGAGERQE